jgi:hypothetical protein
MAHSEAYVDPTARRNDLLSSTSDTFLPSEYSRHFILLLIERQSQSSMANHAVSRLRALII